MNNEDSNKWGSGIVIPLLFVACGVYCLFFDTLPRLRRLGRPIDVSGTRGILFAFALFLFAISAHIRKFYDFPQRILVGRTITIVAIALTVLSVFAT